MTILERIYRWKHKKDLESGGEIPYYWKYSVIKVILKPIKKFVSAVVIPVIPFNFLRIFMYRLCGYKIGKRVFIGMRCYLDDLCCDKIIIEDDVTISYGVYFACHGRKQSHNSIILKRNSYIGMRSSIIAKNDVVIGEGAIIGACTLVNKSIPDNLVAVGVPCRILTPKINGRDNVDGL